MTKVFESVQQVLDEAIPQGDEELLIKVASQAGFSKPQIVSAFRSGHAKVPLDKAFALADALGFDRAAFFTLSLKQFLPDHVYSQFLDAFGRP